MEDKQNIETRFYVGRINKKQNIVEVVSYDDWNGLFTTNSEPTPAQSFPDAPQANRIITALNGMYDDKGVTDFRCYLLRNVENLTHVVGDIDENFSAVFNAYFNVEEDVPTEPPAEEPVPELPAEETP